MCQASNLASCTFSFKSFSHGNWDLFVHSAAKTQQIFIAKYPLCTWSPQCWRLALSPTNLPVELNPWPCRFMRPAFPFEVYCVPAACAPALAATFPDAFAPHPGPKTSGHPAWPEATPGLTPDRPQHTHTPSNQHAQIHTQHTNIHAHVHTHIHTHNLIQPWSQGDQ